MIVTVEVNQTDRFSARAAFEASIKDGPEWMMHQTETASSEDAAFERFAARLAGLYSHRATFEVERAVR